MSNCKIFRNRDKSINKVMDEFGNESQLYQDTLFHVSTLVDKMPLTPPIKHYLDKGDIMDTSVSEVALGLWAYSYSKHFRDKYNITKSNLEEVSVDDIIRHIEEYYPKPVTATPTVIQQEVKEGVEDLFNSNPELSTIGTQEQYSQYLDTVFPDSKVKDIVYRGDENYNIEEKILSRIGGNKYTNGIYFAKTKREAAGYINDVKKKFSHVFSAILNLKAPKVTDIYDREINTNALTEEDINNLKSKNIDGLDVGLSGEQGFEYLVFEPEQIHILGSKQDIQGFKKFVSSNIIPEQRVEQITNIINSELPFEIANAVTVVEDVPLNILGNTDLYLSMKDILEEKGITDPFLVNWLGINKTGFGNFSGIYSEQHLQKIVESNYNRKLKDDNPILKDKNIKENFDKWVAALENYPIVFKDLMLKHAIKNLNKDRRNKYILQLSPIALQQTYGLAVNKPHELNRIGKLYDQEVLKTVSDAIGHEVSASGNGYWVHIPRTTLSQYRIVAEFINDTYGNKYVKKFFNIEELFTYAKQTDEIYQIIGEEDEIDKEDNLEELKKNVELIRKLSPSTWCTATYMAEEYVNNYDNYLLIVNGVTVVGVEVYPQEEKYKLDLEPITKEKYDEAVETSYRNSNNVIGEFTEDGEIYYVDINDKIRYKRDNSGYYKESTSVDLKNVPKRKVNEVTSRNNNGVASIDHLDDTIAFFEKHNLDLNNSSLNRAISKKEKGLNDSITFNDFIPLNENDFPRMMDDAPEGVDIEITYEEYLQLLELQRDQQERIGIDRFNGEYEFDPPEFYDEDYLEAQRLYEDEYREYEILINTKRNEAVNVNTVEEAINFIDTFNFIDIDAFVTVIGLNRNLLDNEQVANKIVETNAYGIEYIDNRLPFYKELAHKALTINANVYDKLSYETQLEQRNIDLIRRYNDINENSREEANDLPFSKNNTKLIQGYYNPKTDEVVVVANNISTNEASKIAIHEVAHRGIIRMAKELGGARELNKILFNAEKQLMKKLPELLKRTGHKTLEDLVRDYGFNIRTEDGKAKLLAELAARWSETLINKPKPSWWKKFITDIKNWITKFTGKILNEEEVNELIGGFVRYGTENIKETPTYNPETKSKTELLDEFNRLIEVSEKMGTKYPDDAINKIKSFLQDLNFKLSTVKEILDKRGLNDNPKAVIDFAYNTIAFGDGATVEDFAEEIGHLIALHAPQDKNLDRALEAIKDTQLYKDNYLDYVKTYSKPGLALEMTPERKAALEVLGRFYGKMLTGTLTEKDMKISKLSVFKRIMNFIRRQINKTDNFNLRNYLESNRDNFFLEPGKDIKSKEIFYSLEQSENVAYNKMFNAIDNMITSMKSRMAREIKDVSAPLGEYSKRQANLQTQLALLYQMQGNIAYDSAIADFLKSLYVDSANIFKFLEKYFVVKKQTEEITLNDIKFNTEEKIFVGDAIIENNSTTLTFDMFRLGRLKKDADLSTLHYSQLSELREFLMHYNSFIEELGIENLSNNLLNDSQLDDLRELLNYVTVSLSSIENALNILNSKKMPESIENLIDEAGIDINDIPKDIVDALKDTNIKGDVGMMQYLMGTTRDSSQPILRLFNATVKNIMHIAKRNTLSFAGKFLDKLNHRIGQSMDWAYEKYNGKFTGYLLSEYNYGWFKNERDTFFKEINAKYEYPVDFNAKEVMFNRIITRFNNNDKYKEELKALKVKLNKELDANKRTQYEEQIDTLNTLIDNVELDHRKLKSYQNEINNWFKDNTVELENVEEIIQSVINDPELSSTEKTVWYNNNVITNEDGDVMGYKNELVRPSSKYINPDYKKLSSTDLEDLNYIKETKAELDKFLPTKINRLAPQTYQSAMDTLIKTQLPELVDKLKFLGKNIGVKKEDDEIGELVGDRVNYEDETRIIKYNPTRYTKLLLEPNNISTDLLSSMIAYAKMVSEFKEKAERIEQLEFIAQNIKNGYTVNTDTNMSSPSNTSNLVKQMENYLRVQIMGITYPDVTIPVLNVKPTKLLKNFARFVTLKNLGLNFATQFVDFTTSRIWYQVEKTMGDTVTRKSSALGFATFKELAQDSIKESSSTIKNNKLSAILRTLGLSDNLHSVFNDLDKNILMRDATNKVLFAGYRASNFYISGNAALAGMYNFRLYNGKWYTEREFGKIENPTEQFDSLPSAYDNMRVENGLMTIDGMNTKTLNLFTRRMNNLISKIDGKLTEEDKTYAHSTLIGIVTLIHRDWILDGISRRLKKRGFNFDTNAVDEGYWLTTARFMKDFFANKEKTRNLKFLVDNYNALSDIEKEGVRRTMKELMVVVGSIALAIIMNLGDDDDDRELDYIRDMAAYLATRSTVEITAFYNPFEYLYAATDVFVIGRDLKRIISFTEMFDAREIESGKWEGWTRSQKYFLQNIPGVNGALSLANPEASNRFIINNVLGFAGGLDKLKYYDVPLIGTLDDQELLEIERDKR